MQTSLLDTQPKTQHSALQPEHLIGISLIVQALILPALWSHTSDSGNILGRYSTRYAAALGLEIILLLSWLVLFLARSRAIRWLVGLPMSLRYGLLAVSGLAVFGVWFLPIELILREALAIHWLLAGLLLIRTGPDGPTKPHRWAWGLIGLLALLTLPILITVLTGFPFSPDEAMWADIATSPYVAGGVYARTWLQAPVVVSPGLGWSSAAYGWLLQQVAFNMRVGRLWNFSGYLLAFVGIGAVTARLYGRQAAVISVAFAALSRAFIPILDYRPDHQLPAAGMAILFAAIQARYSKRPAARAGWHLLAGLMATLSLELHAAGIVFAFGLALFYLAEFALSAYRLRRLPAWKPLLWFGLGAGLGTSLYYVFNILPVGGVGPYLDFLSRTRGLTFEAFPFLKWNYIQYDRTLLLFESVPVWGGLAYLLWRRSAPDRLFLAMLACILIGIVLFDRPGYQSTFSAAYAVPIGALLVGGFARRGIAPGTNRQTVLAAAGLIGMLVGQSAGVFINWAATAEWLRTGRLPPTLYEELQPILAPHIRDDDVIVSTVQLLWTLPNHRHLIHFGAELTALDRWGLQDPVEVWERVQPTVIVNVQNHMHFDPGLQSYLERHVFQVCQHFEVQNHVVEIYREECPTPA